MDNSAMSTCTSNNQIQIDWEINSTSTQHPAKLSCKLKFSETQPEKSRNKTRLKRQQVAGIEIGDQELPTNTSISTTTTTTANSTSNKQHWVKASEITERLSNFPNEKVETGVQMEEAEIARENQELNQKFEISKKPKITLCFAQLVGVMVVSNNVVPSSKNLKKKDQFGFEKFEKMQAEAFGSVGSDSCKQQNPTQSPIYQKIVQTILHSSAYSHPPITLHDNLSLSTQLPPIKPQNPNLQLLPFLVSKTQVLATDLCSESDNLIQECEFSQQISCDTKDLSVCGGWVNGLSSRNSGTSCFPNNHQKASYRLVVYLVVGVQLDPRDKPVILLISDDEILQTTLSSLFLQSSCLSFQHSSQLHRQLYRLSIPTDITPSNEQCLFKLFASADTNVGLQFLLWVPSSVVHCSAVLVRVDEVWLRKSELVDLDNADKLVDIDKTENADLLSEDLQLVARSNQNHISSFSRFCYQPSVSTRRISGSLCFDHSSALSNRDWGFLVGDDNLLQFHRHYFIKLMFAVLSHGDNVSSSNSSQVSEFHYRLPSSFASQICCNPFTASIPLTGR